MTPLLCAVYENHMDCVKFLLSKVNPFIITFIIVEVIVLNIDLVTDRFDCHLDINEGADPFETCIDKEVPWM